MITMHKRNCPKCQKEMLYKYRNSFLRAERKAQICPQCCTRRWEESQTPEKKEAQKQRRKESSIRTRLKHAEKIKERKRRDYHANKIAHKDRFWRKTYGISYEQGKQMFISQGGKCAICGNVFKSGRDIHVDHNHTTGQVRELLCNKCNCGLGNFSENPQSLQKAIDYVNKWNAGAVPPLV